MFLDLLRRTVIAQGATVTEGDVVDVDETGSGVRVRCADGSRIEGELAVLAGGAWLSPLARRFGVRQAVQAGRGYSFRMPADGMPTGPTYLPGQRVVCTPLRDGGVRVSGIMEFARPDRPFQARRVETITAAASTMLGHRDWSLRTDEWVGSRPCTADGLPLVGRTASPRVLVNGGHGMWGVTQGPATAKLLVQQIVSGHPPIEAAALDPLR